LFLGGETTTTEGDPVANITALRMAITSGGNLARSSRSKRGKDSKTSDKRRDNEQGNEQITNVSRN
jgi:antitoxin (DNA-binding transcriptional repressor) of toxin-antitoxin stability system